MSSSGEQKNIGKVQGRKSWTITSENKQKCLKVANTKEQFQRPDFKAEMKDIRKIRDFREIKNIREIKYIREIKKIN